MRHPFETWPSTGRRAWFVALTAAFVVVSTALLAIGAALDEGGLLALELASDHDAVERIVTAWVEDATLGLAAFGLGLDMAYLAVYGLLLAAATASVAAGARARGATQLAGFAALAAWLALAAAGLDVVENAFQVPYFSDPRSGVPAATAAFATLKFVLLLYVLGVLGAGAWVNRKARPSRR